MAYTSSSQSSISSLSRKEDISRFEFNVTSPILKSKKNRKKKIGKLVDQVKKFKKQAPKIHDDASKIHSDDMGYHSNNDPIFIFDPKETETVVACTTGTEFFESKAPTYKSNYSESVYSSQTCVLVYPTNSLIQVDHHHHKFLSKIKRYHSSHLHLVTSMIQSDDGDDDDELEEAQEKDVKIQHQHRHKHDLKTIRSNKKYFKRKKKPKDQTSAYYFSSVSSSTTTATSSHKRKRLYINLINKRKRQQHGKRVPIATTKPAESAANEQERKSSLIQIRHQMMDFKIPADWTCISSKVNKCPTTTTTTNL
ncbi:Guanine nucleotide exchange factor lte1 [Mucor velutinosus]|uniref:Guanine nucleotide exchange factor lte1 n=1 Tax=Mucor velutinosus TaxID=708070 RepID=A0AAN7DCM9_9FUNG|nr:Guanine nucleotide exchange factor lte1 [Mucor velutinosus]